MAKKQTAPDAPRVQFETGDRVQGIQHWQPVWCAPHHFETLEKRLRKCPHGCPPGPSIRVLASPAFEICAGGSRGGMKGQPLNAKVMTPWGWVAMGDLKVGSMVSNPDGSIARVIGVYPLGEKDIYEVTFVDGAKTWVTEDHLWIAKLTCRSLKADRRYAPFLDDDQVPYKIFTTEWLRDHIVEQGKRGKNNDAASVLIPLARPVEFTSPQFNSNGVPMDGYVMGLLLGDGCLRSKMVRISTADSEIASALIARGYDFRKEPGDRPYDWRLHDPVSAIRTLQKLGVYDCRAEDKFVNKRYLDAPVAVRREVLQGLMDTDGCVDGRGHCSFSSASKQLALDVQFIARSLGFKATLTNGATGYRKADGEFVQCLDAHKVYIQGPDTQSLFKLSRKRERCRDDFNGGVSTPHRRMVSIEKVFRAEAQCIAVDHPNQLYITDDFIVTHNTETGRGWLIKGNTDAPVDHAEGRHELVSNGSLAYCGICVNNSYIAHPRYRALILRENEKDLADWVSRARSLYEPMGASVTEKPARIVWPSGATFVLGHMKDSNAYTDYMGQEFHRMLFEELTQIPEELLYLRITMSCRSTFMCSRGCKPRTCKCGALRPQVLATTNPGNAGHLWVKKRFISIAKPNTIYTDPLTKLTRTYIPSRVTDNPYLMRDRQYVNQLEGLPEPTRSAWLLGDWDALGGQYFRDFRPKGPLGEGDRKEPPEARHVIDPGEHPLAAWWPRWIGGDWGYDHGFAIYGACKDPNGQIIVYKELVGNETGGEELGARIARAFFPDMIAMERERLDPKMTFWLSPDAFGKRDATLTIAEAIAEGIQTVLGPNSAHFPDMWETKQVESSDWDGSRFRRFQIQQKFGIAIRPAQNARIAGWQHIRDLLRFRQLAAPNPENYDHAYYCTLLHDDPRRAESYRKQYEARKPEILPRLLITSDCPGIIDAIPTAVHEEDSEDVLKTSTPEDDRLDGLRYLLHSQNVSDNREPEKAFVHRHLESVKKMEPNIDFQGLVWAARFAEAEYASAGQNMKAFNFPIESSRAFKRRRVN